MATVPQLDLDPSLKAHPVFTQGKVIYRAWTRQGPQDRRVKTGAYGYDLVWDSTRYKRFMRGWTKGQAQSALLAQQIAIARGRATAVVDRTLGELRDDYLSHKRAEGKRSLKEDTRILATQLLPAFGATRRVREITNVMIAQYEKRRLQQVSAYTVCNELGVLRHMLRLGKRWGYLHEVPEIVTPKKPEGRVRYLEEAEIARLLTECDACHDRSPHLWTIVTIAVNTGMRQDEIMGLAWERIDLATSRITLYRTKSGKPRGVPINRAVYEALIALQPDATLRVGRLFTKARGEVP
jgi:integrase